MANAAAILLSLMKELQKESQAITHLAGISSQWCSDASHQSLDMTQLLQGQLDDATVAVQQIDSDLMRLKSEIALATSTQEQREQQLKDAVSTAAFALAEFKSEQEQLNRTLVASEHAIRLVKAQMQMDSQQQQQLGGADAVVNNLLQTSADHLSEDEKEIMSDFANDPKPSQTGADRPQQLLQTLTGLLDRLQKEQTNTFSEHQVMSTRLWSFTDHLNSSIMESKSQLASIGIEMSQRKRERTRLDGKVVAVSALLSKVEESAKATQAVCATDSQHKASIQKFIEDESDSLRATLKQMPQLSSELLFDLNDVVPVAPSFLEVHRGRRQHVKVNDPMNPILSDLKVLASRFPEDSAALADAQKNMAMVRLAQESEEEQVAQNAKGGTASHERSPIGNIQAFLKGDGQGGNAQLGDARILLGSAGVLDKVTGMYSNLLASAQLKEKAIDDQLKWCGSIARDATIDSDAVDRSLKWTRAKLKLVNVAMDENEGLVAFCKQQQSSVAGTNAKRQKLAGVEDDQLQQSYQTLKQYGQQLLSLESDLSQRASEEDHKGAEIVRKLLDRLEKHQGLIQQWRVQAKDRHQTVDSTAKTLEDALGEYSKQVDRCQVRLKVEAQALNSLLSSKTKDKELSDQYLVLSQELCSSKRTKQLGSRESTFRQEASSIQKSLSALSSPSVLEIA